MKIKGEMNFNYVNDTFSLNIVDSSNNVLVKGRDYPDENMKEGFYIITSFSTINCKATFKYDGYEDVNISYSTDGYIKL